MTTSVVDNVRGLLPKIRDRVMATERERRVSAETVAELQETGVFQLLQPKRHGGLEGSLLEFYDSVRLLAGACGSTGWTTSVLAIHAWQLGLFPDEAQHDVWGDDPRTLVSSSYAPTGQVTRVDGGYRLSGTWNFSSGCDHAQWAFLGGAVFDDDGNPIDFGTFLVPRSDYRIHNVWNTVGLRGTGSNDIVIDDAFVPAHRMLSFNDTTALACPGNEVNTAAMYRVPFATAFSYSITAPIIGMAEGAYDAHVQRMRERVRISYGGQKVKEDGYAQVRIARAASDIDAAVLQLRRNVTEMLEIAERGEIPSTEIRTRARRDQVLGTARAINAVDLLFENSGGHALAYGNAIERNWRDAHAGRVHAVNDPERALAMFGMAAFGIDVNEPMI